jgi:hypothetical protein
MCKLSNEFDFYSGSGEGCGKLHGEQINNYLFNNKILLLSKIL